MDFISWHYSFAVDYYLARIKFVLLYINHQFSLRLLLQSLFYPWKRIIVTGKRPGFHPNEELSDMMFNVISRGIGAIVRILLFITGIFAIFFVGLFGMFGFMLWVLVPWLSYNLYSVYLRQPKIVIEKIIENSKKGEISVESLVNSDIGSFLVNHLGITKNNLASIFISQITLNHNAVFQSGGELFKYFVEKQVIDEKKCREFDFSVEDVLVCVSWWDERANIRTKLSPEIPLSTPGMGLSLLFGYTPSLDKYCDDMGEPREFTHRLIGRENIVSRIERSLTSGMSVVLTGPAGVGKKTVVYEFATRAREGILGKKLSYSRVLDFDYNAPLSQHTDIAQKKATLAKILSEAGSAGNVILVVRDIHRITNSEVEGLDFTDLLASQLEKKKLKIIVIQENAPFDRFLARNTRFMKYFEHIEVKEVSPDEAFFVLLQAARRIEKTRGVFSTIQGLREVVKGSDRYISDSPLPEKALELFESVVIYQEQNNPGKPIVKETVRVVLSEKTGLSLTKLGEEEKKKLSNLENILHERLISQDYPVTLIAKALRSKTTGVVDTKRPIGSFLFLGPTGVGKTETAKVLNELYFGKQNKLIRFDMAEYAGGEGLERLIGSATRGTPGLLTQELKNHPSSLLLLDEIEKAPPEVFNVFLSLLDEGRVTDAFGNSVNASHTFVIGTSNAGSEYIRELVSEKVGKEELQKKVLEKVLTSKIFPPEFINRFDGVVVYEPLSEEDILKVAKLQLSELSRNMENRGINLKFSEEAVRLIARRGYDPALGARPLRRSIEIWLGDAIAQAHLKGDIKEGDNVNVGATESGEFIFEKIT